MTAAKQFVRRIEVHEQFPRAFMYSLPVWLKSVSVAQLFEVESERHLQLDDVADIARAFFDPVLQRGVVDPIELSAPSIRVLDVKWRDGVTDNRGQSALEALHLTLGKTKMSDLKIQRVVTGEVYYLELDDSNHHHVAVDDELIIKWGRENFANPLVQSFKLSHWNDYREDLSWQGGRVAQQHLNLAMDSQCHRIGVITESFPIEAPMADWQRWNETNSWALSRSEIQQIRDYFSRSTVKVQRYESGLPENPTDVEIEIIAQSWSEHCKHKIFAAEIEYSETKGFSGKWKNFKKLGQQKINSLFKSKIVAATKQVEAERKLSWLSSTFSDNAGMVRFDPQLDVSIKVETHNSPSALDPYGGALTGILGVNRDILGTGMGARPVANTDVLCFGQPDWSESEIEKFLPSGLKAPHRIMAGVHKGIEDGGNKSGIPVVNGAMVFDDGYCGKPLVYCGTIGVSPAHLPDGRAGFKKHIAVGDLVVMAGGRVGKDGIHGATFSSLELNESAPHSAVQIGDPLTQKRLADFIIAARDLGLYSGLTDNGAGGLSSSVGEMAQFTGGACIDVARVPLKYQGLMPWETVVSESQERMTLAVSPDNWPALETLARQYGVEVSAIGVFDDSGQFVVEWNKRPVAALALSFLFDELIPLQLKAEWQGPQLANDWVRRKEKTPVQGLNLSDIAKRILRRPNVASKESWVRRFDHEVQAATVNKPFCGVDGHGPADAGVIWLRPHGAADAFSGVAIGSGINSKLSAVDTYLSALLSIDEAVRNVVCSGGDPEMTCLVDNFCWPDPLPGLSNPDHAHKTAQLVRACAALFDVSTEWGMPFVSGKDSMKNDYSGNAPDGRRVKISVPPTVLITAMAKVQDVRRLVGSDFKDCGDLIYMLGPSNPWPLIGSEFDREFSINESNNEPNNADFSEDPFPDFDLGQALALYKVVHSTLEQGLLESIHDVSDGGLFTAIAESAIGGECGVNVSGLMTSRPGSDGQADMSLHMSLHMSLLRRLFHEGPGRFIVSVKPDRRDDFLRAFAGLASLVKEIGVVTGANSVTGQKEVWLSDLGQGVGVSDLSAWWRGAL